MDDQALRTCICETGRELLENGLVARTWGNVSARADGGHYLVTPSGMDYGSIAPEDIALCCSVLLLQETVTVIDNLPDLQPLFPDRPVRFILFFFLLQKPFFLLLKLLYGREPFLSQDFF